MAEIKKTEPKKKSVFELLNSIDVSDKKEQKGRAEYISWAIAWQEVLTKFPDTTYEIKTFKTKIPKPVLVKEYSSTAPEGKAQTTEKEYTVVVDEVELPYNTDGNTAYVQTSVTIDGKTQEEFLHVMDNVGKSIPLEKITSADINKSIKRCLTKNLALFGYGLNLWTGDDLSDLAVENKENEELERNRLQTECLKKMKDRVASDGLNKDALFAYITAMIGTATPKKLDSIEKLKQMKELIENATEQDVQQYMPVEEK